MHLTKLFMVGMVLHMILNNNATGGYIAPGQGFMVGDNPASGTRVHSNFYSFNMKL